MHSPTELRLPVEPLVRIVNVRQADIARWGTADQRSWHRAKKQGYILERAADRICIKHLDIQPELVWPELTR